jgi:restriction system protein
MGRRKKEGDIFTAIAVLIALPFLMNPSKANNFLNSLFEVAIKLFIVCAIGYSLYWFFSRNKRKREHLKAREFVSRKPIRNKTVNNSIRSVEKDFYKVYKESKDTPQLSQSNQEKPKVWSKELINTLEWKRFEELCSEYFNAKGYKAKVTRQGADGGIDIHLFKESYSLTKAFGIVQCKAWNSYKVGVKPVRELFGVMAAEQAPLGVFITSGSYTKEAEEFSKGKHLKLISGDSLLVLIQALAEEKQQALLKKITTGDYLTPSCPSCGIKMTQRTTKKGKNIGNKFWGCINFPKCRNTLHIKNKA